MAGGAVPPGKRGRARLGCTWRRRTTGKTRVALTTTPSPRPSRSWWPPWSRPCGAGSRSARRRSWTRASRPGGRGCAVPPQRGGLSGACAPHSSLCCSGAPRPTRSSSSSRPRLRARGWGAPIEAAPRPRPQGAAGVDSWGAACWRGRTRCSAGWGWVQGSSWRSPTPQAGPVGAYSTPTRPPACSAPRRWRSAAARRTGPCWCRSGTARGTRTAEPGTTLQRGCRQS
mmetsp:Transcript_16034/g.50419  ORF Transcript_16034/g.50419 Transcript_16034/m.50419 type:complete len:228 (+) Transcript_16034:100-783(+)